MSAESFAALRFLIRTRGEATCVILGGSMLPALPSGAIVRIIPGDLEPGQVVAFLMHGDAPTVHRIQHRCATRSGLWIIACGDGNSICDVPIHTGDVAGVVTGWRFAEHGDAWLAVPPLAAGAAASTSPARLLASTMARLLRISPRVAIAARNIVLLLRSPRVWIAPYEAGATRSAARVATLRIARDAADPPARQ